MGRLPHRDRVRKYQLQELWDDHKEINRRLALGQKNVDIAQEMHITPALVSYTKHSTIATIEREKMQAEMDGITVDVGKRIRELGAVAVEVLAETMSDPNSTRGLRTKVAMDILDRAGYGAVQRTKNENHNYTLTSDALDELKRRGREAGIIRDIPSSEVSVV